MSFMREFLEELDYEFRLSGSFKLALGDVMYI